MSKKGMREQGKETGLAFSFAMGLGCEGFYAWLELPTSDKGRGTPAFLPSGPSVGQKGKREG